MQRVGPELEAHHGNFEPVFDENFGMEFAHETHMFAVEHHARDASVDERRMLGGGRFEVGIEGARERRQSTFRVLERGVGSCEDGGDVALLGDVRRFLGIDVCRETDLREVLRIASMGVVLEHHQ